ncbi:MAG: PilZ domain-containing protein [Nitrospiria bacterium]
MEESRRAFVRVTADCPILYRVVDTDDKSPFDHDCYDPISSIETQQIMAKIHTDNAQRDDQILELLLWIDWKVNYLIKTRSREKERERFPYEAVMVNLSASGMRFHTDKQESPGTRLEFRIILPILPFKEMTLIAEVIHIKQKTSKKNNIPQFEVGIKFLDLKHADQESLFSYIVKRERQIRHAQHKQEETPTRL